MDSVPCVCNDDVVEGCVFLAEAGEADFDDHVCGIGGWVSRFVDGMVWELLESFGPGFRRWSRDECSRDGILFS